MNTTTMLAPLALAMGLAAAPSSANGAISVAVPAIVVDVNGVLVSVGGPPPPPPVVVVREPAPEYVVVHDHYYPPPPPRNVVVVHDRHGHDHGYRQTQVVYVEDGRFGHDHGACRGHDGRFRDEHVRHHGGWERQVKHHGGHHGDRGGNGKGHGRDKGHGSKHAKYRR